MGNGKRPWVGEVALDVYSVSLVMGGAKLLVARTQLVETKTDPVAAESPQLMGLRLKGRLFIRSLIAVNAV